MLGENTVFHGDAPPRVGGSPPTLPMPRGLGGSMGNVSQHPPFCKTWGNAGLGVSQIGGLPHAPS